MDYPSLFQYKDQPVCTSFIYNSTDPDPTKREHYYNSRNPTKILDQLLVYYQLRRSSNFSKYSLDATAKRELGVGKLDYSMHCNYIGDFPYVAYKHFLMYNIIDIFMMLCLDKVTNDTFSQVYSRFNLCTEWGRVAKPLARTTNVFDNLWKAQGFIPANEINSIFVWLTKDKLNRLKEKSPDLYNVVAQLKEANVPKDQKDKNPYRIKGGCVSSPNKIDPSIKENKVYKIPIKTYNHFEAAADDDATAMYPSNTEANNGSKSTLLGVFKD